MTGTKWTDYLPGDIYSRLCHCKSTKEDLPALVNAKWRYMKEQGKGFTKEDALIGILELLDANGQWQVGELTKDEYNELKEE